MHGYDVITSDDEKVGHVVGHQGGNLIVEHGTIFKSRHALPGTFVDVDDDARVVRTTISKEILESSPKVEDGAVDERAVAEHYGLAWGYDEPATAGKGELNPDDPARTADMDAKRADLEVPEEERARIQGGLAPGEGPLDSLSSPGLLSGDRRRDAKP